MQHDQTAIKSRFKIIDGKSEQLFCAHTLENKVDAQKELDFLLRHPQNMNMPSIFILDSDKTHRNKVIDEWISRNKIGINIAPNEPYSLSENGKIYMAVDTRVGAEETLLKTLQSMVSYFPKSFQCSIRTKYECEDAIEAFWKSWANFHPIFIIRDIENMLSIKRKKDREIFACILKNYYNEFHCSFVFTGTLEGAHALHVTEQYSWRFLRDVLDFDYDKQTPLFSK